MPQSLVDAVSNYVIDNVTSGVELNGSENSASIGIKFYIPTTDKNDFRPGLKEYLSQIVNTEMPVAPKIQESTVLAQDWVKSYRESIQPVMIDNVICVRPPWGKATSGIKHDIIIEPKMAFGTGHHETTRTCLHLIFKYFKKDGRFLDFGCGSGVLSILADKLGAGYIKAIDYDMIAIENTNENFGINQVKSNQAVEYGSFEKTQNERPFDMVCANLAKSDIIENFGILKNLIMENGHLILSGILDKEQSEIDQIIINSQMPVVEYIREGEWLTYCLGK
ncbi:MAG: 50S ribosomal protein L11 methyltransferase [Candidatus Zixiibacteriota bacterium]